MTGIEALKRFKGNNNTILIARTMGKQEYLDCVETIEKELKRLKEIDNAKPSEALEDLNEIIEYITEDKKVKYKATILFDCEIIKDALLKAQKQERIISGLEDYIDQRLVAEPIEDARKAFLEIRKQLHVIKEVLG